METTLIDHISHHKYAATRADLKKCDLLQLVIRKGVKI